MVTRCKVYIAVDGWNFKKRGRNLQDQNISGQESNRATRDHSPYVNSPSNQESNAGVYSVPMEYEDLGQFDSNPTGDYHELNQMTLGVPQEHVYSSINNKPSTGDVYEQAY